VLRRIADRGMSLQARREMASRQTSSTIFSGLQYPPPLADRRRR
jgi:hypothetical protein